MAEKQNPSKNNSSAKELKSAPFSRLVLVVFVLIFGGIGAYVLIKSNAAPAPPAVYTTTPAAFLAPNTNFSVDIRENSSTTGVNVVQANLNYPSSLTLVSIDTSGSAFGGEAQTCPSAGCTVATGTIKIARFTPGGVAALTGDQKVATLNFKTNSTGGAATVNFVAGTILVRASDSSDLLAPLGGLSQTSGFTTTVDNQGPTVAITSPTNGAPVAAGTNVTVTATATDNQAISSAGVSFYVDGSGTAAATDTSSPYSFSWNTTGLSLGTHTLQAKASDPFGNQGASSVISVTVADQTPPTVSLGSQPATIKGTVTLTATATDAGTGVNKVEFYDGSTLLGSDSSFPYSFSWNTTTASNASHSLTAKAYDNASPQNSATSTPAVVTTVDNSAPTSPGNLRSTSATLNSISLAWNASTDNNAVTGYVINRNGTPVTTTSGSTLSYTDNGLAPGTAYSYTVTAIDAAGNNSTAAALNNISTLSPKTGDVNGDNTVNGLDVSYILNHWETGDATGDLNHDSIVNGLDLSVVLFHWEG